MSAAARSPVRTLRLGVALVLGIAWLVVATPRPANAAAPFTMHSDATYRMDPQAKRVDVAVRLTFTNTTPDTPGHFSLYRSVPISLQPGASSVAARDASGVMAVTVARHPGSTLATVQLRAALRYRRSVAFTLSYRLVDGAASDLRVRPSMVVLPVWSFGTDGAVVVQVPAGFTPRSTGAAMTESSSELGTQLSSGAISDPAHWRLLLSAARNPAYLTVTRSVPLTGGTVDLRVRAWDDDAAWAERIAGLAVAALPRLQQVIGLPYTGSGPLDVSEAAPAGLDPLLEGGLGAQDIEIAFNAPSFTVLHQLAHLWLSDDIVSSRWIREGLASLAAARVATQLKVALPYEPSVEAAALARSAFPLDDWAPPSGGASSSGAADQWAYAAAWAFMNRLVSEVDADAPFRALRRAAAGASAYAAGEAGDADPAASASPEALDSRQLLDQLEEASGSTLDSAFRGTVFGASSGTLLDARLTARAAAHRLADAAGGWGIPQPVATALDAWRFDEASAAIAAARAWLSERDGLLSRAATAGLTLPGRLAASWRSDGGGPRSQAELRAEGAVIDAYVSSGRARTADPNPVEALGMLGGPTASELRATAAGLFASGDLNGALGAIERANEVGAGAQAAGVVRIGVGAALLAVLVALVALATRRVRQLLDRRGGPRPAPRPPSA